MIASKEQVATKKPTKNQKLLPSVFDTKIQEIYTSRISPRRSVIRKREPKNKKKLKIRLIKKNFINQAKSQIHQI